MQILRWIKRILGENSLRKNWREHNGWVREQSKHLGKGMLGIWSASYVCHFSSKAVAYGFGEYPSVPKIAALLKVCFRYFVLDKRKHTCRGCHCLFSLFTACNVGCRCKLFGPSVNASWGCIWAVFLNRTMLLMYIF